MVPVVLIFPYRQKDATVKMIQKHADCDIAVNTHCSQWWLCLVLDVHDMQGQGSKATWKEIQGVSGMWLNMHYHWLIIKKSTTTLRNEIIEEAIEKPNNISPKLSSKSSNKHDLI